MTLLLALVQVGLRIERWILPWVAVVFVSATLAFAVNGALAGGSSASDQRRDVQVAASTTEATGSAPVERSTTSPSAQSISAPLLPQSAARQSMVATWTRRSTGKSASSSADGRPDVAAHGTYCP